MAYFRVWGPERAPASRTIAMGGAMREGSEGRLHSKVCGRLARFMGSWVHGFMGIV